MKKISIGLISFGSFLIGASVGLKASEWADETDVEYWDDDLPSEDIEDAWQKYRDQRRMEDLVNNLNYTSSEDMDDDIEDEEDLDGIEPLVNSITIGGDEVPITKETKSLDEVKEPQVISEDFYFNDTEYVNYAKETLTYFEDDDTLIDEKDQVIYNVEEVIGTEALNSFGHMSNDKDTVFVINHRFGIKYEVIRDDGSYKEIILGIADEEPDYTKAKKFFKELEEREE